MATKKKPTLSKSVPTSTEFEYWIQTATSLVFPTVKPPTPAPTPAPGASTSSATLSPSPYAFIKANFAKTVTSPFGTKQALPASHPIREVDVICAALTGGYGSAQTLNSVGVFTGAAVTTALRRYLGHRLEMLAACLDYGTKSIQPKPFYKFVETTEKGAISFVIGTIGTHVAAKIWIKSGGSRMSRFLHSGIYSKAAIVPPSALIKLARKNPKGKIPDFLVQDSKRGWHAFESKGGTNRWEQIVTGLEQLNNVSTIRSAKAKGVAPKPKTTVCVHTRVDHDAPLSITLVDPPNPGKDGSGKNSNSDSSPAIQIGLVPGVPDFLTTVEALEWFHGLDNRAKLMDPGHTNVGQWVFNVSSAFQGLILGLPKAWIGAEQRIRLKLARYLALQEAMEIYGDAENSDDQYSQGAPLPEHRAIFIEILKGRLQRLNLPDNDEDQKYNNPSYIYNDIYQRLEHDGARPAGALHAWSYCLNIPQMAAQLMAMRRKAERDRQFTSLRAKSDQSILAENGLYIEMARME